MCWTVEGQNWEACSDASLSMRPTPGTYGIDPAAVPVPAIPSRTRTTTDGDSCMLPTVYQVRPARDPGGARRPPPGCSALQWLPALCRLRSCVRAWPRLTRSRIALSSGGDHR
jgi:hypothetical protein